MPTTLQIAGIKFEETSPGLWQSDMRGFELFVATRRSGAIRASIYDTLEGPFGRRLHKTEWAKVHSAHPTMVITTMNAQVEECLSWLRDDRGIDLMGESNA